VADTPADEPRRDRLDPSGILAELADVLQRPDSFGRALQDITALAERSIPGVHAASVTLIDDGPGTVAASSNLATTMDETQYRTGWGPCLAAAEYGQLTAVDDMSADQRWPDYAAAAIEAGIGSSLSAPLPIQQRITGALNLYSQSAHAFSDVSRNLAESFAAHAALELAQAFHYADAAREARELQEAMRSRAVIEQAKGMLMALQRCTSDDAFQLLVGMSQKQNRKLRDVASELVMQISTHPVGYEDD
jgi:GAF domain-containing protein